MDTTLQIRIDRKTKEAAQKSLRGMGLNLSSGIKLFIAEVARTHTVPFTITSSAEMIPESEKEKLVQETKQVLQKGKRYGNASDMHRSIS